MQLTLKLTLLFSLLCFLNIPSYGGENVSSDENNISSTEGIKSHKVTREEHEKNSSQNVKEGLTKKRKLNERSQEQASESLECNETTIPLIDTPGVENAQSLDTSALNLNPAQSNLSLAFGYSQQKQYDKAIEEYNKALEVKELQEENRVMICQALAIVHYNFASAYADIKQYKKAIKHLNKALEIKEYQGENRAQANQLLGMAHNNLGSFCYAALKKYDKAIKELKKALQIEEHQGSNRAGTQHNLGMVYVQTNQNDKAIKNFNKALGVNEHQGEGRINTLLSLGNIYSETKQDVLAMKEYLEILKFGNTCSYYDEALIKMKDAIERISVILQPTNLQSPEIATIGETNEKN